MFALTQSLRRAVQIRPNGISTIFGATRRTWTQTAERVARIAGAEVDERSSGRDLLGAAPVELLERVRLRRPHPR